MTNIYLSNLEIWDLKGFEHFEAKLGQVSVISGCHGSGKTSAVVSLASIFEAGGDPGLIRIGCKEGKAKVTFSNGYSAVKTIKPTGATLDVFNPEGGICAAPASLLQRWLPRASFNPQIFLDSMDAKKRTEFILDNLPISYSVQAINECLNVKLGALNIDGVRQLPDGPDKTVEEFDKFYDEVDSARSAINRAIENLKGAMRTLETSLPQDDDTDWNAAAGELQATLNQLDTEIATVESDTALEAEQKRSEVKKSTGADIEDAQAAVSDYAATSERFATRVLAFSEAASHAVSACQGLRDEAAVVGANVDGFIKAAMTVKKLQIDLADILHKIDVTESETIRELRESKAEERARLAGELGAAREKAKQQQQGLGVKKALEKSRAELKGENARYEKLTLVLDALRKLKAEKMRAVNIPGFDISWIKLKGARSESAVILINGIPLDEINRQQALFVALQLVLLAQKANTSEEQLPLVIMETMDLLPSYREDLIAATQQAGLQLVITVAEEDKALTVEAL